MQIRSVWIAGHIYCDYDSTFQKVISWILYAETRILFKNNGCLNNCRKTYIIHLQMRPRSISLLFLNISQLLALAFLSIIESCKFCNSWEHTRYLFIWDFAWHGDVHLVITGFFPTGKFLSIIPMNMSPRNSFLKIDFLHNSWLNTD